MPSEKKGFSGLEDLISDISEDVVPQQAAKQPVRDNTQASPKPSPAPSPVNHSGTPQQTAQKPAQHQSSPQSNGAVGWVVGGVAVVVLLAIIGSSGTRQEVTPSLSSSVSAPTSPYVLGISDLSSDQDRLIGDLLQAGQGGDSKAIEVAALAIDKALSSKPSLDKAAFKESRAKNKVGLQAHKDGNDELAVKQFFDAYKLNPYDPEIADNLGFVLYAISDFHAARKAYLAALIHSSRRASAWGGLAKVFAVTNSTVNAASAFALAFRFSKSPKTLRQTLITSYPEEKNLAVKNAIGAALATHYSTVVADFVRPVLGNLAGVGIPVYLPTTIAALDYEGKPLPLYVVNNEMFQMEATLGSYRIPVASEPDCRAMACGVGALTARKVLPTDLDEGDPVELQDGVKGTIVKAVFRDSDHLVFRVGDIRYSFSLGNDVAADIEAAKSALKLGVIPVEVFSSLPRYVAATPPQPAPMVPIQAVPTTPPVYLPQASNPDCNTTYDVALETFGEGVTVELRYGSPGSSTIVKTAQSAGGNVHFGGLCAGSYFMAIGNSESVNVTPVRNFDSNMEYSSSIRMQRGSGNVTSKRRNEL